MKTLQINQLEQIYDDLATAIDQVPDGCSELFLAKLVMLMANDLAEPERFADLVRQAQQKLRGS